MRTCIFTICAKNYLARARILMESLRRFEPDALRLVVLSDRIEGAFDPAAEAFEVLEIERLPIADLRGMCFRYDVMELATAVKPSVLRHLLTAAGFERVIYLDPDTQLLAPLDSVRAALDAGASSALTPHALEPLRLGGSFGNAQLQRAGAYNLGFLALAAQPEVLAGLAWWEERLRHFCRRDQSEAGEFVDQKWMDCWPLLCPGAVLLRDPGLNVAYWNLDQRPLRRREGRWFAGEAPLAFLHFSGFRPGPPLVVSQHRAELRAASLGEGLQLFEDYAQALQAAGLATTSGWRYAFGQFADGRAIPYALRQFHREVLEPCGGDPFEAPAARFAETDGDGLTRFMRFVLRQHPDVARQFALSTHAGRLAFRHWFAAEAEAYFGLPRWLVQANEAALDAPHALAAAS